MTGKGATYETVREKITEEQYSYYISELLTIPEKMKKILEDKERIQWFAAKYANAHDVFFVGRGIDYAVCLEGSLKLKEISYLHAEGYPAGELKHGPLALVDAEMPVVTVAPNDELLEKLKGNMEEVRARKGELFVFSDQGCNIQPSEGMHVIQLPENYAVLSPILHVIPLQLLAYHTAIAKGTDVDKPRNLAKSVTTE